jgi:hypothetical protein
VIDDTMLCIVDWHTLSQCDVLNSLPNVHTNLTPKNFPHVFYAILI